jgi:hypothetical protein
MSNELRNKTKTLHAISLALHDRELNAHVMIMDFFATIYVTVDNDTCIEHLSTSSVTEANLINWLYAITGANS